MPTYTYSQLKSDVNQNLKGKIGVVISPRDSINRAVRKVVADVDMVSTRRKTALTPNLFSRIFEYAAPTDLKGYGIINIEPQTDRPRVQYGLVPYEQFMRRRDENSIAVSDNDFIRKILINTIVNDKGITLATLDALTSGGGTWGGFGDTDTVSADSDNYVRENGSIKWNINASAGTTAGIVNSTLNQTDLTDYFGGNGSCFVWVYITSITGVTNFILRIGSSTGDYYSKTITTASDGTALTTGWNLIRFDLSNLTETGTVDQSAITYSALIMTKDITKVSEDSYRFDSLIFKIGEINNVIYYSNYGWQSNSGTYKENSTTDSDVLNAGTEEYEMMVEKATEILAPQVDEYTEAQRASAEYLKLKKGYEKTNPSEAMFMVSTVADFIRT